MTKKNNKPPFKLLTMEEVNEKKGTNGYNIVSTFTGAGGSCIGLKLAGFNILYAVEFIEEAQKTYALNHSEVYLDKRDIREIKGEDILRQCNLNKGELDLLEGSPPCSGFSQMGIGSDGWNCIKKYSDSEQRVDDLFFEFIRLVKEVQPKMVLCENVPALATGKNKGYLKLIINEFKKIGYDIHLKILNSQFLNVPQVRKRLIFIGVNKKLDINVEFPKPLNYSYIINDAIPNYKDHIPKEIYNTFKTNSQMKFLFNYCQRNHLSNFAVASKKLWGRNVGFAQKLAFGEKSCPTIIQATPLYHSHQQRTLSIDEAKILHTFPIDFKLTGSFHKQWERIGRSVPPRMYEAVGLKIKESLDDYYGKSR